MNYNINNNITNFNFSFAFGIIYNKKDKKFD